MSTQPIGRSRLVVPRRGGAALRRAVVIAAVFAGVFAGAFALGHTRSAPAGRSDGLPPSLPSVATPVPASLAQAPAIEVGVALHPPQATTPASPPATLTSPVTPASPATTPSPALTTATPAPSPAPTQVTTAPQPAPPVTPPAKPKPAPAATGGSGSQAPSPSAGKTAPKAHGEPSTSFDSSG